MSRFQYLPLSDDKEFETFICDLYRAKEGAEDYDLYRVSGAAQHGTDVYSLSRKTAIQCKCHDYNKKGPDAWKREAAKELKDEFKEFLKHPHLADYDRYIFCTTLPKSSHVEKAKEEIQRELIDSGSTLTILYQPWETLSDDLEQHPDLVAQYGFRRIQDILLNTVPLITDLEGFIGREIELKETARLLDTGMPTALVRGMGGMGKTTLAKAYIWQNLSKYQKVIWLTLDQPYPQALQQDIWLLDKLGIKVEQGKQEFLMERFREKLQSMEGQNLLVLDNASPTTLSKAYREVLPQQGWHILLTSREQIGDITAYPIDHLPEEEALLLFRQYYHREDSDAAIKALLEYIDYHTLTTELLAKTLQKSTLRNTAALLAKLKDQSLTSPQINKTINQRYHKEEEAKLMTILTEAFTLQDLSEDEIALLQWFACFPPQVLPLDDIAQVLQLNEEEKEIVNDGIKILVGKGWIEEVKHLHYRFHRLFAELIPLMKPIQWQTLGPLVIGMAERAYYDEFQANPVDFFHWLPWSGYLIACTKDFTEPALIDLLDCHGRLLRAAGNYQGAKIAFRNALALAKSLLAPEDPILNLLQSNLAIIHQALGEYTEAKALLAQALAGYIAHDGEEHPNVQVVRSNLALVHKALGEYAEAKALLEQALAGDIAHYGEEHPVVQIRRSNLAMVYRDLGRDKEAKPLLEQALAGDIAHYGEEHPSVQIARSNLAIIHQALGEYTEAKALLAQALAGYIAHDGEEHPNVQTVRSNLATVHQDLEEYTEAKALLEQALAAVIVHYGEEHPSVQITRSNLAMVHEELGEYAQAKALLEQVLEAKLIHFEEGHPTIAITLNNLAYVHMDLGEMEAAKEALLKAYAIFLASLGPEHPHTQSVIYSLGKRGWLP